MNRWVNWTHWKYYWNVTNSFVVKKVALILFPFRHSVRCSFYFSSGHNNDNNIILIILLIFVVVLEPPEFTVGNEWAYGRIQAAKT